MAARERPCRLVLVDRCADGERHIHRWVPRCACGRWWGIAARTEDKAARQHRKHVGGVRRATRAMPRKVTPEHLLPAEMRSVA